MKIAFFKNETHFPVRSTYTFENAKVIRLDGGGYKLGAYLQWILIFPLLAFLHFFSGDVASSYIFVIVFAIVGLPLHELCHALFCWGSGRGVERICFFPYKNLLSRPVAYVKPAFGMWNKGQFILFSLFPLLLLSVIPAALAVFIASVRVEFWFVSLFNLLVSSFDIADTLCILKTPRKSVNVGDFILAKEKEDKPMVINWTPVKY